MGTLRRTLLWPISMLLALTVAAAAFLAWDYTVEKERLARKVADIRVTNGLVLRLSDVLAESQSLTLEFLLERDERGRIARLHAEAEELMSRLEGTPHDGRGALLKAQLVSGLRVRATARAALFAAREPDERRRAFLRWELSAAHTRALADDLQGYGLRRLDRAILEMQRRRAISLAILGVLVGGAAFVALVHGVFVSRGVVGSLRRMADAAERIGAAQEGARVPGTDRDDEIGVLARALERTTTDLVAANVQLAEGVRARDDFLSIASHELKTPLTPLKLQLETAARRLRQDGAPPRWLATSLRQVVRLETLVAQLLDVTRIRAGRLVLRRTEVDLRDVVSGATERLGAELAQSGNTVGLALGEGAVGRWDGDRLEQVVANLLSNAMKYAPGSRVEVRVEASGTVARLVVRDEGPGIPAHLGDRLFERFERAPGSRDVGGLGLGLYIVRQIVEAHGGRVWLDGGLAGGAAFHVELPRDVASVPGEAQA
jgi:signal transduction histidine kinase